MGEGAINREEEPVETPGGDVPDPEPAQDDVGDDIAAAAYTLLGDEALAEAVERAAMLYELDQTEHRRDQITAALNQSGGIVGTRNRQVFELRRDAMQERASAISARLWPIPPIPEEEDVGATG